MEIALLPGEATEDAATGLQPGPEPGHLFHAQTRVQDKQAVWPFLDPRELPSVVSHSRLQKALPGRIYLYLALS